MRRIVFVFFLIISASSFSQHSFLVMTYNVENLFDAENDSLKEDDEYIPTSFRHWNRSRFWDKLKNISRVIVSASDEKIPDIVCLCEVENDSCLHYLTHRSPLRSLRYEYLMTESNDHRGINVALLYQPGTFLPVQSEAIRPCGDWRSRDVLHVVGVLSTFDTLDVYCVHFPSRYGGRRSSDANRMNVATLLKHNTDSVMKVRERPNIIILGDFNASSMEASLRKGLCALVPDKNPSVSDRLYVIDSPKSKHTNPKVRGTYCYKGKWENIDHIIVNGRLLKGDGVSCSVNDVSIIDHSFLLEPDLVYGGMKPFRTYVGPVYNKGYSDHLPLTLELSY